MDKNYALRFLTWSYFKIDINDIIDSNDKKITCENIIKACIEKAYSDATMQGAYNTLLKKYVEKQVNKEQNEDLKKKIEKDLKEKNDSLKKEAEKFLSYGISILLGEELNQKKCYLYRNKCYLGNETSKEKIDYGKWHDCMCDRLCEIYKENEFEKVPIFSYGNAQKWVNMTVKYLCVFYNIYETANLGHGFWGK